MNTMADQRTGWTRETGGAGEAAAVPDVPAPEGDNDRNLGDGAESPGLDGEWVTTDIEVSRTPSAGTRSQVAKRKASDEPPSAAARVRSRSSPTVSNRIALAFRASKSPAAFNQHRIANQFSTFPEHPITQR